MSAETGAALAAGVVALWYGALGVEFVVCRVAEWIRDR